jgi:glycosyltransferase involved in cell wall biosynthesis
VSVSVLHLNFSRAGGAGSVARTLWEEQVDQGYASRLHTTIESDLRSRPFSSPLHTAAAVLDRYGIQSQGFHAPISLARDLLHDNNIPSLQDVEVLHLHGINGAITVASLAKQHPSLRIVWTLHDMNPFTGTCHYTLGCRKFQTDCGNCPAVRVPFRSAVSQNLARKRDAISALTNLTVVTPSRWLADQAAASSVFAGDDIVVQPNPISPHFGLVDASFEEHTEAQTFRAVVVAKNLDDPVKNVSAAVENFSAAFPELGSASLHLVGAGGGSLTGANIVLEGLLAQAEIARLLAQSDVLIVPSLAENSPLVIPEAASQGCASLVANVGGMPELVDTLSGGGVFNSPADLVAKLTTFAAQSPNHKKILRKNLIATSQKVFSPRAVVAAYDKVYAR